MRQIDIDLQIVRGYRGSASAVPFRRWSRPDGAVVLPRRSVPFPERRLRACRRGVLLPGSRTPIIEFCGAPLPLRMHRGQRLTLPGARPSTAREGIGSRDLLLRPATPVRQRCE